MPDFSYFIFCFSQRYLKLLEFFIIYFIKSTITNFLLDTIPKVKIEKKHFIKNNFRCNEIFLYIKLCQKNLKGIKKKNISLSPY